MNTLAHYITLINGNESYSIDAKMAADLTFNDSNNAFLMVMSYLNAALKLKSVDSLGNEKYHFDFSNNNLSVIRGSSYDNAAYILLASKMIEKLMEEKKLSVVSTSCLLVMLRNVLTVNGTNILHNTIYETNSVKMIPKPDMMLAFMKKLLSASINVEIKNPIYDMVMK